MNINVKVLDVGPKMMFLWFLNICAKCHTEHLLEFLL